jgi:sugar transferase EpsL
MIEPLATSPRAVALGRYGASPSSRDVRRSHGEHIRRTRRSGRVDSFMRRGDTWLARMVRALSSTHGEAYAASRSKRALDLLISVPALLVLAALVAVLLVINKALHHRYPAMFRQDRVGHAASPLSVLKIRSMVPGSARAGAPTRFGRFVRRYYLDELPQLWQVLRGQLSLVGIRVLPRDVYDGLSATWSQQRFSIWAATYAEAPLGLTGVHQVLRASGKEDGRRFRRDVFYARRASLGLDLYLLWRTLGTTDI